MEDGRREEKKSRRIEMAGIDDGRLARSGVWQRTIQRRALLFAPDPPASPFLLRVSTLSTGCHDAGCCDSCFINRLTWTCIFLQFNFSTGCRCLTYSLLTTLFITILVIIMMNITWIRYWLCVVTFPSDTHVAVGDWQRERRTDSQVNRVRKSNLF